MISADYVGDPMIWLQDHPTVKCPVEVILAGQLLVLRLQELYEALIIEGSKPNPRLLVWLRKYLGNWRSNWSIPESTSSRNGRSDLLSTQQAAHTRSGGTPRLLWKSLSVSAGRVRALPHHN